MDARNWQVWFKLLSPYNEALAVLASAALTRDNFPNMTLGVKQPRKQIQRKNPTRRDYLQKDILT